MVKVAVLGANGFVGSRLVEMLHLGGALEVRPVVRSFPSLARLARFDLDCRVADGLDQAALTQALQGCDIVVHAIVGDPKVITGTISPVYQAAQTAGIRRIIYLSTASVHGQAPEVGTSEDSPLDLRQPLPYNLAKIQAETLLRAQREEGSVEIVILRPGIVFGPRSRWVAGLADDLIMGKAYLLNQGKGICNTIYVDNLIYAILLAIESPNADRQAFLLGDQDQVTWLEYYQPFVAALGLDLDQIPRLKTPKFKPGLRQRLDQVRSSDAVQSVLPYIPAPLKRAVKGGIGALQSSGSVDLWQLPASSGPQITQEMALLHQCRVKLPYTKAEQLLGYKPQVSFSEGCRRSIGWLAFAGYPVALQQAS